jgi:hypothetical protein
MTDRLRAFREGLKDGGYVERERLAKDLQRDGLVLFWLGLMCPRPCLPICCPKPDHRQRRLLRARRMPCGRAMLVTQDPNRT